MTNQEAIDAFTKQFGGFPYYRFMGVDPDGKSKELIDFVEKSLTAGKPVELTYEDDVMY